MSFKESRAPHSLMEGYYIRAYRPVNGASFIAYSSAILLVA